MMKSLYSGVAGLKTHNTKMDVIGNNVSNVNTTGYKAGTVTFQDIFYQSKSGTSAGDATQGGKNPTQIGYGVQLNTINQVMTQSGFTYSDSVYDCAIEGEGFFQVMDEAGNIYYSRAGVFSVDNFGNLIDANKNIVLGVSGDPTGIAASSQRINLYVPDVDNNVASATREIDGNIVTISAADYGTDGNISFTIVDGDSPFATLSGSTLRIEMPLDVEYATADEFEAAVNEAIRAGGVDLGETVLPLQFEFDGVPADTAAVNATNTIRLAAADGDITNLNFTAATAGEFGNAYEINLKTSESATGVTARWSNGVLTVTLPANTIDENGDTVIPAITVEDIQNAINRAAGMTQDDAGDWSGGNEKKMITVSATDVDGGDTDFTNYDFTTVLGGKTQRVGLSGGADNFFANIANKLSTVKLEDGRVAGPQSVQDLESVFIDSDGVIYGVHSVHGTIAMGRIDLVTFENPTGLEQAGSSYWVQSLASGEPEVKIGGQEGAGDVVSGALEMSNVDLSQEFSDMIITQRGFQANSRIITVADTMLEELVNLKR